MIYRLIIFLLINFGALAFGGFFTGKGVSSAWYDGLEKAPWTPPGWVFGFAWTTIMICFSFYMACLWPLTTRKNILISLFALQWLLNVAWNPAFFYYHQVGAALLLITGLTLLVAFLLAWYWPLLKLKTAYIFPYLLWLVIATSLNGYIWLKNA